MHVPSVLLTTYAFASLTRAFRLPFAWHLPWAHASDAQQLPLAVVSLVESEEVEATDHLNRIAIIGAGAGGSSAAFFIGKAKERWGLDIEVDLYDANSYIGGRSTTVHPYSDPRLEPVELGASIFVEANKNLWRASDEFGFERQDFDDPDGSMGLWDGSQFLITTKSGGIGGWWSTLKILWRYGVQAPRRVQAATKQLVQQFMSLYSSTRGTTPFTDLADFASVMNWTSVVGNTTAGYFDAITGGNGKFTRELIEAATRVNYGQNADRIHGMGGAVSLAAEGASSAKGGNWQIFEQFVKRSGANVSLDTTVRTVTQLKEDKFVLEYDSPSSVITQSKTYRAVILAAPYHSSSIALKLLSSEGTPSAPTYLILDEIVPAQPYVHLHVTLLSTPSQSFRSRYFGMKSGEAVPPFVMTTWQTVREAEQEGKEVPKPEFNSLSRHGKILLKDGVTPANLTALGLFGEDSEVGSPSHRDESGEEWVVKIFSDHRLEDAWLRKLIGKWGWLYRKEWDAYPYLTPTTTFPPVKLANGMYYVNSFEPLISTMETETLSGRNIVELLMREHFNASICNASEPTNSTVEKDNFVYGWDC